VKSQAGKRVRRGSAPGRKRAPHVRIRLAIATSAKRERGPTKQHRVRIHPASAREITKIRFGFASGITRQEGPIGPERVWWTQKCSTNGARLREGEKSFDSFAAAPDWSRRIINAWRSTHSPTLTRQVKIRTETKLKKGTTLMIEASIYRPKERIRIGAERFKPDAYITTTRGLVNIVSGVFTPVLAKHSKSPPSSANSWETRFSQSFSHSSH
jgi:hypothetical protein